MVPEGWAYTTFEKHIDLLSGYPFKSSKYSNNDDDIRLLRGDNIEPGALRWRDAKRWPKDEYSELSKFHLEEGDFVIAMDRTWISSGLKVAEVQHGDLPCLLVQRVSRIRSLPTLEQPLLRQYFSGHRFEQYVKSVQTETAVPHISASQINEFPVMLPPIEEQRRMAKILSTWDEAIATTEQLLANSEQQKKALMQQLLTGKKRLPGFDVEWNRLNFSKLVSLGKSKFDPKTSGGRKECIELEHISQETSNLLGSTNTKEAVSTKNVFGRNSILFGKLRPYLRKHWLSDRCGVCSTEIWVFNANPKYSVPEYVFQLVQTDFFIDVASKSSGTHMPRADWNLVKDVLVQVPPLEEQRKIASVLAVCSQQIASLRKRLLCLKEEKKALMQQLLTGKRRVRVDENQAGAVAACSGR